MHGAHAKTAGMTGGGDDSAFWVHITMLVTSTYLWTFLLTIMIALVIVGLTGLTWKYVGTLGGREPIQQSGGAGLRLRDAVTQTHDLEAGRATRKMELHLLTVDGLRKIATSLGIRGACSFLKADLERTIDQRCEFSGVHY